jgi:hypothetical protein
MPFLVLLKNDPGRTKWGLIKPSVPIDMAATASDRQASDIMNPSACHPPRGGTMFLTVLAAKLITSLAVAFGVLTVLDKPLSILLTQSLPENLLAPWWIIIRFSVYVISVAQGVSLEGLKPLLFPRPTRGHQKVENYQEGLWAEVFTTLVDSLKAVTVVLLFIFLAATVVSAILHLPFFTGKPPA